MRKIPGFDGYFADRSGNVFSNKSGSLVRLTPAQQNRGYFVVRVRRDGKSHHLLVHRAVLMAYSPTNGKTELEVNHKDGVRTNNQLGNLEWCTRSQNLKHAYAELGRTNPMKGIASSRHPRARPVGRYDVRSGKLLKQYSSAVDAERDGYNRSSICDVVNGRREHHQGFIWSYLE